MEVSGDSLVENIWMYTFVREVYDRSGLWLMIYILIMLHL